MIGRRHVFHIGGYDPITPESQLERFRRSLSSFERTWNVSSQTSAITEIVGSERLLGRGGLGPELEDPDHVSKCCAGMISFCVIPQRGMLSRLGQSGHSLFDFVITGALFRYVYANWKYAFFFLFPFFYVALFGLGGAGDRLCRDPAGGFDRRGRGAIRHLASR